MAASPEGTGVGDVVEALIGVMLRDQMMAKSNGVTSNGNGTPITVEKE